MRVPIGEGGDGVHDVRSAIPSRPVSGLEDAQNVRVLERLEDAQLRHEQCGSDDIGSDQVDRDQAPVSRITRDECRDPVSPTELALDDVRVA